jgi:tellurite resistance protein
LEKMMTKDAFNERRQALEDEFFHRVDEKLLAEMKAKSLAESERKQLQEATGISDSELLDTLLSAGIPAGAVAAISLVPQILVAWADGNVSAEEREPILKCAKEQGITSGSAAEKLLDHWLANKPKRELTSTWRDYMATVIEKMSDEAIASLRTDIMKRATCVANASGGILGFGKVSADEARVISEIEKALTR